MPRYQTVIRSSWNARKAFAYMSDFSNASHWDPGVVAAKRRDQGAVGVGSMFDLTVPFAGRTMVLGYRVAEMEAPHRVVFAASTDRLDSVDTLTFTPRGDGCEMTYDARLNFKGLAALANPLLALGFSRIGDRARDSLRKVLSSDL